MDEKKPIPEARAIQICDEVRKRNKEKRFGFGKMQCWGCMTYAKEDVRKRCFNSKEDLRGCNLVNKEYDKA